VHKHRLPCPVSEQVPYLPGCRLAFCIFLCTARLTARIREIVPRNGATVFRRRLTRQYSAGMSIGRYTVHDIRHRLAMFRRKGIVLDVNMQFGHAARCCVKTTVLRKPYCACGSSYYNCFFAQRTNLIPETSCLPFLLELRLNY